MLYLWIFTLSIAAFSQDQNLLLLKNFPELLSPPVCAPAADEPVPATCYTCQVEQMKNPPRWEMNGYHDNDNYLYGLKDITKLHDGNDLGFTYSLGADASYLWDDKKLSLNYRKALFTVPLKSSNGQQVYADPTNDNHLIKVVRAVDTDRLALSFKAGDPFYFVGMIGLEKRTRTNDDAIQDTWHDLLKIRKYYFVGPEANPYAGPEKLKSEIDTWSYLAEAKVGVKKIFFKGKCTVDTSAGAFLSTDSNGLLGQNSHLSLNTKIEAKLGEKNTFKPFVTQTTFGYVKSPVDKRQVGFTPGVGLAYDVNKPKATYEPYLIFNLPLGRQEFAEFNDHDPIVRMGIMVTVKNPKR